MTNTSLETTTPTKTNGGIRILFMGICLIGAVMAIYQYMGREIEYLQTRIVRQETINETAQTEFRQALFKIRAKAAIIQAINAQQDARLKALERECYNSAKTKKEN